MHSLLVRPKTRRTKNWFLRRWGRKGGERKNKRESESIVIPPNAILYATGYRYCFRCLIFRHFK